MLRATLRLAGWALVLGFLTELAGGVAGAREAAARELPAVARPRLGASAGQTASGTAFFLAAPGDPGAVAVAAAHSFDFASLARAGELEFQLPRSQRRVATSNRFHSRPGRPFTEAGASLAEDFVVFALDRRPEGVRILEAERSGLPSVGSRVRILGVPAAIAQDEDDLYGTVRSAGPERIDVLLDVPADLRGWGGAPVLDYRNGRVLGLLEAAWPEDGRLRLGIAPIAGILAAIDQPLEGGLGSPFARYGSSGASPDVEGAATATPSPRAAKRPAATRSSEPPRALSRPRRTRPENESLLGKAGAVKTTLVVQVEHPGASSVVGDGDGAFVAGRAVAHVGDFRRFDVMLVLDTSGSAAQMSGADINGNGIVGQGGFRGIFGRTDAGDSILAAEVAAARQLLRGLDPRSTRVGLVTFAGEPPRERGFFGRTLRSAALTEQPLTSDYPRIETALDRILDRGAMGMTHMAAGADQATIELLGLRGSLSEPDPEADKVVLFLTDGQPTLPYDAIFESDNVKAVLRAADRAARANIRIHSFAIGPEALEGPIAAVEMAERTDGYFTPVRHPGDIVAVIENVSFANIDELVVRNATTGVEATHLVTHADGRWGALVPLAPGRNRIVVVARSTDGSEARSEVVLQHAPGAPDPVIPPRLIADRNQLLERRLLDLKRERIASERERAETTRRELILEIERERDEAQERARRQRKELEIEPESEGRR